MLLSVIRPLATAALLWLLSASIFCAVAAPAERASGKAGLIPSPEPGWPQWRGPLRDGKSTETGLLQSWPEAGPALVWRSSGLGKGYSAPILTGGRIYLAGDVGTNLVLFALDSNGNHLWTATNGAAWKDPYPGARASCAFANGRILHLNAHARVGCFDANSGREIWGVDLKERFGSRNITWATTLDSIKCWLPPAK